MERDVPQFTSYPISNAQVGHIVQSGMNRYALRTGRQGGKMADYESLEAIAGDLTLRLGAVSPVAEDLKHAIDERLKMLQEGSEVETSEEYRKLVRARTAVREITKDSRQTLVPITTTQLVEVVRAAVAGSQQHGARSAAQLQERRAAAETKASDDFRRARSRPLVGLGAVAAAVWGSREAFGTKLPHATALVWASFAGTVVFLAAIVLAVARRVQRREERWLRRFYSADYQATALRDALSDGPQITRSQFTRFIRNGTWPSRLGTVDLDAASEDAAALALERFETMGVLVARHDRGREYFMLAESVDGIEKEI